MAEHIFILGGARSGKTTLAEKLALRLGQHPAYLASAESGDAEMAARIAAHRHARAGRFVTIEEPLELPRALLAATRYDVVIVDCLTLWLSNLIEADRDIAAATAELAAALGEMETLRAILVSNEVGLGIVPDNELARHFRDHAGRLNQAVAEASAHVYFTAAGLPLTLKGTAPEGLCPHARAVNDTSGRP